MRRLQVFGSEALWEGGRGGMYRGLLGVCGRTVLSLVELGLHTRQDVRYVSCQVMSRHFLNLAGIMWELWSRGVCTALSAQMYLIAC
jgi:hypothetical protein